MVRNLLVLKINLLLKRKKIIEPHKIKLNGKINFFKEKFIKVNSFKNLLITSTNSTFTNIYFAQKKSIECFVSKKIKF